MTDYLQSVVPIQCPQYHSTPITQGLGVLDLHDGRGSNVHVLDTGSADTGPYPATSMNHINAFPPERYGSTMPVYARDDPPYLATGPGGHQGIEGQRQLDGHPPPGMRQHIPFDLAQPPSRLEYGTPGINDVPNVGPPSQVPHPYNVVGPFRGDPGVVYFGESATEDLKSLASRYLHNPGSNVDKLRIRRSRSGTVKVLIFLDFPVVSGALRLDQFAPAIIEASNDNDGPPGQVPLNIAGPSRGNPSHIRLPVNSGTFVTETIEDFASRCIHNPGSYVNKLRTRRSRSGAVKVLIQLQIDDTM